MNGNDFSERYKKLSNTELLDILESADDYQPLAVEAARFELQSRQLSSEQLSEAKAEQHLRQQNKARKQQKVKDIEDKVKSAGLSFAETFSPMQKEQGTDKSIKLTAIFLGGLFLYKLFNEFAMLRFMLFEDEGGWDIWMMVYLLPLILLPAAGILIWLRKKSGWMFSAIYFSYTASSALSVLVITFNHQPTQAPGLDILDPAPSSKYIWAFIVFTGMTWLLCRKNIREVFGVKKELMFGTIGLGVLIPLAILIYFAWERLA